jgi:hypothetical protein
MAILPERDLMIMVAGHARSAKNDQRLSRGQKQISEPGCRRGSVGNVTSGGGRWGFGTAADWWSWPPERVEGEWLRANNTWLDPEGNPVRSLAALHCIACQVDRCRCRKRRALHMHAVPIRPRWANHGRRAPCRHVTGCLVVLGGGGHHEHGTLSAHNRPSVVGRWASRPRNIQTSSEGGRSWRNSARARRLLSSTSQNNVD